MGTETQKPSRKPEPEATPANSLRVELFYNLIGSQLAMKTKAPALMLRGMLRSASVYPNKSISKIPRKDELHHVTVDYDLVTDSIAVNTDAPGVIFQGMLETALAMVTQKQLADKIKEGKL